MAWIRKSQISAASDITTTQLVQAPASGTRTAIKALIGAEVDDAVEAAVADSDTVVNAARDAAVTAVGGVLADTSLVRTTDPQAVRQLSTDHPLWASVLLSFDFRVVGGTLRAGGVVDEMPGYAAVALPSGSGTVFLTNDYRRVEPGAEGTDSGQVSDAVLTGWAERMNNSSAAFASLAGWGDSMSTDYGAIGSNQTALLAGKLGVTAFDMGVSADTPFDVAFRMGALDLRVTLVAPLPASGAVPVSVNRPLGWLHARSWACEVLTQDGATVSVTLTRTAVATTSDAPTWTIAQVGGVAAVQIAPGTRVRFRGAHEGARISPAKFWVGRNDPDLNRTIEALRLMVSQHRDPGGRRLIAPVFNSASEPSGSTAYNAIIARNAAIAEAFPGDYFDDRRVLIDNGLAIAGLVPTSADTAAIAEDRIPPSFMLDALHLNAVGRQTLATIDAIEIAGRNWK